ncbi:MAG TPA: ABC transporter substrate-binding protein [Nocardioidaceae bacterium]|nr:ABC transporter substrate-binding protein [Nocardioidaceae bacterium]
MRRTALASAAILAAATMLTACGDDDDGGSSSSSGDVEIMTWWTEGGEKAGLDALIENFDKDYPDETLQSTPIAGGGGSNAKKVILQRLQTGDPPSSFQGHAGAELLDYINTGAIQDVSSLYEEEGWNDIFPPSLIEMLTYDGAIYSVPANIHRANLVWANPSVLKDNGLPTTAPASIDDWIDDMETLKQGGMEAPLAIATDWTQVQLLETVLIADLGPDAYTGLWDGSTDWASSEVTDALDDYATLMTYTNSNRGSLDWPDSSGMVAEGESAYTVMGDWVPAGYDVDNLVPNKDYIWFPVPGTDGVYDFLADSFTLPVDAPNTEGAEDWLRVVGSKAGQTAFNKAKGSIPARTDIDPSEFGVYQQSAMADFKTDTIVPSLAHGAAASIAWLDAITSAVGKFSTDPDVGTLQDDLVSAADQFASTE